MIVLVAVLGGGCGSGGGGGGEESDAAARGDAARGDDAAPIDGAVPDASGDELDAGVLVIALCRLQAPLAIDESAGTDVLVFGRVQVIGITDQTGQNDPDSRIVAELGYGADGSDPGANPGDWSWTAATPNAAYDAGAPSYEADLDEYQATMEVPAAGGSPYDFAYRFSGDGGDTWTTCDGDADGSSDGYAAADAGQMTSV